MREADRNQSAWQAEVLLQQPLPLGAQQERGTKEEKGT
jgi:hypothetical protein